MCNKVAVYGTLRRGGPANGYLRGAKFLYQDTIPAKLYALGWFPGIKFNIGPEDFATVVDVYEIPNDAEFLLDVDRYEGYNRDCPEESLFTRKKVLLDNNNEEVMVYEYCHDVNESLRIESGDWIKYHD